MYVSVAVSDVRTASPPPNLFSIVEASCRRCEVFLGNRSAARTIAELYAELPRSHGT
jgi:hypothetical protein